MIVDMKIRIATALAWAAPLVFPVLALADDPDTHDGRIASYSTNVALDPGTVALLWLMFIVLAIITLAVLFKSARRTHLD
jgi:cytochrome c-type biogenesis protein CcmH/NrfF